MSKSELEKYVKNMIKNVNINIPSSNPQVLVVPCYPEQAENYEAFDKTMASVMKAIVNPEQIKTVLMIGAHFPKSVNVQAPNGPFTFFSGSKVKTQFGEYQIDENLRKKMLQWTGKELNNRTDKLINQSTQYDIPFLYLKQVLPKTTQVLPALIYATYRDEVQFIASVIDKAMQDPDYQNHLLIVIPIQVSSGLSLFQNVYIENILLDLTFKNEVTGFENWLYFLTGNTGATFSDTLASQILVVRLSQILNVTKSKNPQYDQYEYKWRLLNYLTTYDDQINKTKMIQEEYREIGEQDHFNNEKDNPKGQQIFYAMSLSLEQKLKTSVIKDGKNTYTSAFFGLTSNVKSISKSSLDQLLKLVQKQLQGENVSKLADNIKNEDLLQNGAFRLRVYVLANKNSNKNAFKLKQKDNNETQEINDKSTCKETILLDIVKQNFYTNDTLIHSVIQAAKDIYNEKLNPQLLNELQKEIKQKYQLLKKQKDPEVDNIDIKDLRLKDNLIVELQLFNNFQYKELFSLTDARGYVLTLYDGKTAICDVPESRPELQSNIFFRLSQCALKNGWGVWDWQKSTVNQFERQIVTKGVYQGFLQSFITSLPQMQENHQCCEHKEKCCCKDIYHHDLTQKHLGMKYDGHRVLIGLENRQPDEKCSLMGQSIFKIKCGEHRIIIAIQDDTSCDCAYEEHQKVLIQLGEHQCVIGIGKKEDLCQCKEKIQFLYKLGEDYLCVCKKCDK